MMTLMTAIFRHGLWLAAAALALGCAGPDDSATEGGKRTSDSYTTPTVRSGDPGIVSIDAEGRVAPFGMASRKAVSIPETELPSAAAAVAGSQVAGAGVYGIHCIACHGADGSGVQGLGVSLTESALVDGSDGAALVAFLQAGRAADDPANVTGIPMPSFAWMPAGDLAAVAEYLKSLP